MMGKIYPPRPPVGVDLPHAKEFAKLQGFDFSAASGLHTAFARYASDKAGNGVSMQPY